MNFSIISFQLLPNINTRSWMFTNVKKLWISAKNIRYRQTNCMSRKHRCRPDLGVVGNVFDFLFFRKPDSFSDCYMQSEKTTLQLTYSKIYNFNFISYFICNLKKKLQLTYSKIYNFNFDGSFLCIYLLPEYSLQGGLLKWKNR